MSDTIEKQPEPSPIVLIPKDLDGNDLISQSEYVYWVGYLQDIAQSATPILVQIKGDISLFPNSGFTEKLEGVVQFQNLNEILEFLSSRADFLPEESIQAVYSGEIIKNLQIKYADNDSDDIYCNIYPLVLGQKVLGTKFEFHFGYERKKDKRATEELLAIITEKAGVNSYILEVDPKHVTLDDLLGMFLNENQSQLWAENLEGIRDTLKYETLIVPEMRLEFYAEILGFINEFINSGNDAMVFNQEIKGLSPDGFKKIFLNEIEIKKGLDGRLILKGCLRDVTEQIEQMDFQITLLDIIEKITSENDYGQQLELIVERIKMLVPDVGTISVAIPNGDNTFRFHIRRKFEDSEIQNFNYLDEPDVTLHAASIKIMNRVLASKEPIIIGDFAMDEPTINDDDEFKLNNSAKELVEQHSARSYVGIPVTIDGVTIGVMNFSSHIPDAFSEKDIKKLVILSRFLGIAIDRDSFLNQLQNEIKNAVMELGKLLTDMNDIIHGGKTPLSVIGTNLYLIIKILEKVEFDGKSEVLRRVNIMTENVGKIKDSFNQVLHAVESRTKNVEPTSKISFEELYSGLEIAAEGLVGEYSPKNALIDVRFSKGNLPDGFNFISRKEGLTSMIENLISNAIKYCHEDQPGVVNVSFKLVGQVIEICVEDNGIGIQRDFEDKVFVLGERASNVGDRDGTGKGLPYVKKFVESLGGSISFKRSRYQTGTEFKLVVPLKDSPLVGFLLNDATPAES